MHLESAESEQSRQYLKLIEEGKVECDKWFELGEDEWLCPGFVDTHSESNLSSPIQGGSRARSSSDFSR